MLQQKTLLNRFTLLASIPLALAACASSGSGTNTAILNGMQGEEENSLCFNRDIRSWHQLDDSAIVVEARNDEYYKLELAGGCNTRNAFMQIAVESRGSSCLTPGDRVTFDRDLGLSCSVTQINRWHLADMDER
ncbi:DUF6491 family protein [Pseudohongiella sp.]|uniref:Lipoprotein n=1 Tax=marine sediment metagenome TaxID=412755 RepID=A0A0F9W3H1_9ZZZZ|nr:DUF6491 family protein [Pseudohongiella sp.]HDZ08986.1 hypothetical protein [Pseudohongiella sp.]HEA62671.1 hypothetical protein [Pseudohongiella sp.]